VVGEPRELGVCDRDERDRERARLGRGVAAPGFVDLQANGFGGVDLLEADADGYRRAGEALLETGVTSYLPTFISAPEEDLVAALRAVPAKSSLSGARAARSAASKAAGAGTGPRLNRRDTAAVAGDDSYESNSMVLRIWYVGPPARVNAIAS